MSTIDTATNLSAQAAATRMIAHLTQAIVDHADEPMLSSACLCREDAVALYERGDYLHALTRSEKGLTYLIGFLR